MDSPGWPVVVLGIWAALGPTLGVWFGQYLAKLWHEDQWLAENRKQEYRELISALTASFGTIVQWGRPGLVLDSKQQQDYANAEQGALHALASRLYIHEEITKMDVLSKWLAAMARFDRDRNAKVFSVAFGSLIHALKQRALAAP